MATLSSGRVSKPSVLGFTIANGASLSDAIDLKGLAVVAIEMPAAWTAANLTFQSSLDGVTYNNVYDKAGTEYSVTAAASRYISIARTDLSAVRYLKVRSGTSGVAVNQAAARTVNVVAAEV